MSSVPGAARCRRRGAVASTWVVVVSVVVLGAAAAPRAAAVARAPERPRLLVIGDSIILGTNGNIAADLPDWDVVFDAAVSRSTAVGPDVLAAHGTNFSVVVVALGANDGASPDVFAPRVAALLDALAPLPHVVWLTIHEARPYYAQANAVIRDQVARHPNAIVGDWNAAIRPGDVGADGLHLTGQGSAGMAAWVAGLVRLVVAPPPTTTTSSTTTSTVPPSTTTTTVAVASSRRAAPATSVGSSAGSATLDDSAASGTIWWIVAVVIVVVGLALVGSRRRRRRKTPTD